MPQFTEAQLRNIWLPLNINRAVPNNLRSGVRTVQRPNNSIQLYQVIQDWVTLNSDQFASTFLDLTDTPSAYTPNQILITNAAGTGVEFQPLLTLYTSDGSLPTDRIVTLGTSDLTLQSTTGTFEYSLTDGTTSSTLGASPTMIYSSYVTPAGTSTSILNSSTVFLSHNTGPTSSSLILNSTDATIAATNRIRLTSQINHNLTTENATASIGSGRTSIFADASAGSITLDLPALPESGDIYYFYKDSNPLTTVTLNGNGNLINDQPNWVMNTPFQTTRIIFNGTYWTAS